MTVKTDILIEQGADGIFDEAIGEDGDSKAAYGYETSIYMTVHCDASATEDEVGDLLRRQGWGGNESSEQSGFELGSKLWLKYQSRKTQTDKNEAVAAVKTAMAHFVPDRAKEVRVTGNVTSKGITVNALILRYNGETDNILFELWDTTGATE